MWFSVTITSMFTLYLDIRTTDSVAIYCYHKFTAQQRLVVPLIHFWLID